MTRRGRLGRTALRAAGALIALVTLAWLWTAYRPSDDHLPAGAYEPRVDPQWDVADDAAAAIRGDALARASVWREPADPIDRVDLTRNAGDAHPLDPTRPISCKFLPQATRGTTPKFDCILPDGEVLKVKYGGTAETFAEVAASRLVAALGFGADRMDVVPRVRCFGCPFSPFRAYQALELVGLEGAYTRRIDYARYRDFEWPAVERRFEGAAIDTPEIKGWRFDELERIDPARGGASRAQVDALRLMAVFLHHWDNKAENQRLVCLVVPARDRNGPCPKPFAFMQDLGSTFGPTKVHFEHWSTRPVWSDPATCDLNMKDMPYAGATFAPVRITEEGRRFLADELRQLSEAQVHALFTAARFPAYHSWRDAGAEVANWVRAFRQKVSQITDRAPCPS